MTQSEQVLEANRRVYDKIAGVYDDIDSRRGGQVDHSWVDRVLQEIRAHLNQQTKPSEGWHFLDAGSGSGFLSVHAHPLFEALTLVDLSQPMLDRIELKGAKKICADCSHIPLPDASVDVIGAFATLHHLFDPNEFFKEAYRLLRPGGVLYTDHDIEKHFVKRFRLPLKLYRAMFDHGHEYLTQCPTLEKQDYELSEYHGDSGLDIHVLSQQLRGHGFTIIEEKCHWEGMGKLADAVKFARLSGKLQKPGWAPVVRLIARK